MIKRSSLLVVALVLSLAASLVLARNDYVFVHGEFQDSTTFQGVRDIMEGAGYDTLLIDLPANSQSSSAAQRLAVTYNDYIIKMDSVLSRVREGHPVVLVCHGSAGALCQISAGRWKKQVRAVVFVNAWILPYGKTQGDLSDTFFENFRTTANASNDRSVPLTVDFVENVFLQTETLPERDEFIAVGVTQPIIYMDYNLTKDQRKEFDRTEDSIPRYVVLGDEDKYADFREIAQSYLGRGKYTEYTVDGGHEFFFYEPARLAEILWVIDFQLEDQSESAASTLVVAINALLAAVMATLMAVMF